MLILPNRQEPKGKVFLPMRRREWQRSDRACTFGIDDRRLWSASAHLSDGAIRWRGWFEDREDWDAFAFAALVGSLAREPALWELPTPHWHPGLAEFPLTYSFAAVFVLTANPGSNSTWLAPPDWTNTNTIYTIAGGASGATSTSTTAHCTGGGGGANNVNTNFSATANVTTATYRPGLGGTAVTSASSGGVVGGDAWFNGTAVIGSTVGSKGGSAGIVGTGSQNGGAGGVGASGTGNGTPHSGGAGGNLTGASGSGGSGAGGAGGSTAVGAAGTSSSSTGTNVTTAGGQGDPTAGGAGGPSAGNNGSPGAETALSGNPAVGSGGGGAGNAGTSTTAGSGGLYGGGGGGNRSLTSSTSGAGAQGIIVISYTSQRVLPFVPNQLT